jgi:hypothetical protein
VPLGGEHDRVAPPGESLADDLLGLARAVHVRGVDEVDAVFERDVDHADAVVVIAVADRAEHHRPEALDAHLDSRAAEHAVAHPTLLSSTEPKRYDLERTPGQGPP